jgi:mannose-6-phosphate isomerase-like protein (cupin superfamily)
MNYLLLNPQNLNAEEGAVWQWNGCLFQQTNVSLILVEVPPGQGPRLHRHPYPEVFVVHGGQALFTVGSEVVSAHAGQALIVPQGVAHKFVNSGRVRLRQTDIHAATQIQTEWLEPTP